MITERERRLLRIAEAKISQAMIDRALDRLESEIRTKDASGHEHVGAGSPEGGQFGSGGGGGGKAEETHGRKPRPAHKAGEPKNPQEKKDKSSNGPIDVGEKSESEIASLHEDLNSEWINDVDNDSKIWLLYYSGKDYSRINGLLRDPETADEVLEGDFVRGIDRVIEGAVLDRDIVVYRGISDVDDLGLRNAESVGTTIKDPAYMSASLSRDVADNFAPRDGAMLKILAPKGIKGASMHGLSDPKNGNEYEILFARNSTIEITGISMQGGQVVYHAKMTQEES